MKKGDLNRLSMWWAVRQYLNTHRSIWDGNEPFSNASTMLTNAIESARNALKTQAGTSKGISTDRISLKHDAIDQTLAIARSAKVYAMATGNSELLNAVNYGKTALRNMAHHPLVAKLQTIIAAAQGVGEALLKFGVSTEDCDAALKAVEAMEEAQSFVRVAITSKKAVTQNVPEIMDAGSLALTWMDNLLHLFKAAHPEFVAGYKTTRAINHAGIRHNDDASTSIDAA